MVGAVIEVDGVKVDARLVTVVGPSASGTYRSQSGLRQRDLIHRAGKQLLLLMKYR